MRGGGGDAAGHISTAHGISTSEGVKVSGVYCGDAAWVMDTKRFGEIPRHKGERYEPTF